MKNLLAFPLRALDGFLDRVCAVLGAVGLSQFPQFFAQYLQRLGGHKDEAGRALEQYIQTAATFDLTLEEYIEMHLLSENEIFVSSGKLIQELLERFQALERSLAALQEAAIYNRWLVFLQEVDWSIAAGTWQEFTPGVPVTLEGAIYALAGLLIGWAIYALVKALLKLPVKLFTSFRRKPPAQRGVTA